MGYILYYNIYISYLHLDEFNIKWSNSMSPLNCQQKIDMSLMSGKQFGLLRDNENPNRLKPKAWLWSPIYQIKKQFLLFLSEEKTKVP